MKNQPSLQTPLYKVAISLACPLTEALSKEKYLTWDRKRMTVCALKKQRLKNCLYTEKVFKVQVFLLKKGSRQKNFGTFGLK